MISECWMPIDGFEKDSYLVEWRNLVTTIQRPITVRNLPPLEHPTPIRFDQKIPTNSLMTGFAKIRIPALRSGIERAVHFSPLGHPISAREDTKKPYPFQGSTSLEADFELTLESLPVETLLSEKCPPIEQSGAPTAERIQLVLEAINDMGGGGQVRNAYVRRVVESLPAIGERSLDPGRWHWDISGRCYEETFPIDFHIVIYGHGDSQSGVTRVEAIVQGQEIEVRRAEAMDGGDSKQLILKTRDQLYETIKGSLQ